MLWSEFATKGLLQISGILFHLFAFLDSSGFIKICLISFLFFTKSFSIRSLLGVYKVRLRMTDMIMFTSQPDFKFPYCLYKKKMSSSKTVNYNYIISHLDMYNLSTFTSSVSKDSDLVTACIFQLKIKFRY